MRLLMISLDAVFQDDAELLLKMPALGSLAGRGVFCDRVQTIYPTLTYPVHTSLITGCFPDRHGIAHNQPFQPDTPAVNRAWYWDAREIRTETLHTAAYKKGMDVASILWPVTGKNKAIRRNFPEVLALPGENQTFKMLCYGSTFWIIACEIRHGKKRVSTRQPFLDDYAVLLCEKLILGRTPDMLTLHLVDCDEMRHRYGTRSQEALSALKRLDARIGQLLNALERKSVLEDTIIAVVSDHGHADTSRHIALDDALKRLKIPARAQVFGMGAYLFTAPSDISSVRQGLRDNIEELGIARIYEEHELHSMHAAAFVHLAVEACDGVEFMDNTDIGHRATHGFGIDHSGAQCLLWLAGEPFRKGIRLSEVHITDIAPTLAKAVGLSLPEAQGHILASVFI